MLRETAHITVKKITPLEALTLGGVNLKAYGPITPSVLVSTGPAKFKRYRARFRKGDGHLIYRWGRLISATATFIDGKYSHSVFFGEAK